MSIESGYTATLTVHRPPARGGDIVVVCETWEDGGVDSPDTQHRNPVTRKLTAKGGPRTREVLKLSAEEDDRLWDLEDAFEESAGVDRFTAVRQRIDGRGTAIGKPKVRVGIFKRAMYPPYDLAGDGVGKVEFEATPDE